MSVIIRLQGLSWLANASDIRKFFAGLVIPDGGVHIVGGEDGDAFIAFATDEEARLAMRVTGQTIKDEPVRLMLSSKAEMQAVIAAARGEMIEAATVPALPQLGKPAAFQILPHLQQSRNVAASAGNYGVSNYNYDNDSYIPHAESAAATANSSSAD